MFIPSPPPQYSEETLKRILNDCKTVEELCSIGGLLKELSEAGDFPITPRLRAFVLVKQQELIYGNFKRRKK
jgi:hypothetical protein